MHTAKRNRLSSGGFMLRAAAVIFCLVLVSTYMMSGLYARYISSGRGDDTARVAKFDVKAQGGSDVTISVSDTEADTGAYTLTVTNDSEVAVRYDIVITLNQALPNYLAVSLNDTAPSVSDDKKTLTFSTVGKLAANGATAEHTLSFKVTDVAAFTANASAGSYSETLAFTAQIRFVQID